MRSAAAVATQDLAFGAVYLSLGLVFLAGAFAVRRAVRTRSADPLWTLCVCLASLSYVSISFLASLGPK